MRLFVDENVPRMTVEALRAAGHDVADVRGTSREGMSDRALWEAAQAERRVLITTDRGFARLRDQPHAGLPIACLRQPSREQIHDRILRALQHVAPDRWPGLLLVVRDRAQSMWPPPNREP